MSGARQAARCLYDAGEPSWARSRCYSSSRQPIQYMYTACVGLSLIFHKVTVTAVGKKEKKIEREVGCAQPSAGAIEAAMLPQVVEDRL